MISVCRSHGVRVYADAVVNHQCGTCRMGTAPSDSVVDPVGRAHDLTNLYIADASVFPSSAATNPTLTIAANAFRVGEHLDTEVWT